MLKSQIGLKNVTQNVKKNFSLIDKFIWYHYLKNNNDLKVENLALFSSKTKLKYNQADDLSLLLENQQL